MRHIPSHKVLFARLLRRGKDDFGPESVRRIKTLRLLLEEWRDGKIKSRVMLEEANRLLDGNGVEYIQSSDGKGGAYYINMGDTYDETLVLDLGRGRVWAVSWGGWVEAEENQGRRFE